MLNLLKEELQKFANPEKAGIFKKFFKRGSGEYAEEDIILGISAPEQRKIAERYFDLSLDNLQELINSRIHEHKLTALLILIHKYSKADELLKKQIFDFYLKNAKNINNWDLVDLSAPNILGNFLLYKDKKILYNLAKSDNLWERRISILSTFYFIRHGQFEETVNISKLLLTDEHDLIHKAVGWMLREIGKRDQKRLEQFLIQHYKNMPRTMLRYAIEKLNPKKRQQYLKGEIK